MARDGMESYKSGDMQLRVSSQLFSPSCSFSANSYHRLDGVWDSVLVTAAITKQASV